MRLLSSCVVVEAYFITATVYRYRVSLSNRDVSTIVVMYTWVVPKLWNETIEAHRRAVRDAILETTAALVVEHGLTSVTMSQIAEETGIGRATLYKYGWRFPRSRTSAGVSSTSAASPPSRTCTLSAEAGSGRADRPCSLGSVRMPLI